MKSDEALLETFAENGDEDSFRELSRRYFGLIFHTAMRRTGSREISQEVTQNVLCALARKAGPLAGRAHQLAPWLHRAAVFESSKAMRSEHAFQKKKKADPAAAGTDDGAQAWNDAASVLLDAGLDALGEVERRIVFLHYFEGKTFAQIAPAMGKTPAAVQRQSHRALEKLARFFRGRGVVVTGTVLAGGLMAEFTKAAPASLVSGTTGNALAAAQLYNITPLNLAMASKSKLLLPALLLLVVTPVTVVAVGHRHQQVSAIESRIGVLRSRIASGAAPLAVAAGAGSPAAAPRGMQGRIDWERIVVELEKRSDSGGGFQITPAILHFQQRLMQMEKDEILRSIDEIAATGLMPAEKEKLEKMLLMETRIRETDPELAVRLFVDLVNGRTGTAFDLLPAWSKWIAKDPENAIAWFDEQIRAGKFHGKSAADPSEPRRMFEGALLSTMLAIDARAAQARLAAIPEQDRPGVLLNPGLKVRDDQLPAFLEMVRGGLPPQGQKQVISSMGAALGGGPDFSKVDAYLAKVPVTDEERGAIVADSAAPWIEYNSRKRRITEDDIVRLREWARTHAPDSVAEATGKALIQATDVNQKLDFVTAVRMLGTFSREDGNEQAIAAFLGSPIARNHGQAAIKLAEGLQDAALREALLDELRN